MTKAFIPAAFIAMTDIVVVGTNPEMADYDNRRGEIYGYSACVRAHNEHGDTRVLWVATSVCEAEVLEQATVLADRLTARWENLGKLPVGFDSWVAGRAVYGSDAYIEYGQEEDLHWEAMMNEAEAQGLV